MNAYINRILDMLERIARFFVERPITPAIARVTAATTVVNTTITALRAAGQSQTAGYGEFSGGVDVRDVLRKELRALLRYINRTGRMLDAQHPGIAATFRTPNSASSAQLLAAAEAIELKATELEAEFVAAGLSASFLTELADLIDAYRDATAQKHDGRILRGGSTAGLKALASVGMKAAKELDTCARNHFRGNEEALGAWTIARHVQRSPHREEDSTESPATPPSGSVAASGTTSGSSTVMA